MAAQQDATLGYATDAGRGSKVNQDKLGFYLPDDPRLADLAGQIYVVVDGMGSRDRGAALADLTIRVVVRAYYAAVLEHGRADALAVAMSAADRALRAELAERPDDADAGCAVAAAVLRGDELLVGHVGDCRAYLIRDGRPYRLTDDVADGAYLGRGAEARPVITDAIPLGPGDRILVCSDGLHQLVAEPQIAELVGAGAPQDSAEKLVAAANARGGWDNITALIVDPFATTSRAAPVAPPPSAARAPDLEPTEIEWRKVGIASGLILLAAALVIFRPWQRFGMADMVAGVFAHPTPTLEPPSPTPTDTPPPTAVPSVTPRPTASEIGVPALVNETTLNALQALAALGLTPDIIKQYSATVAPGFVINQDPAAGAAAPPGGKVQVAISLGPPPAATPTRRLLRAWPTWTSAPPPVEVTVIPTDAPTSPPDNPGGGGGGGGGGGNKPKPTDPPAPPAQPTSPPPEPTDKPKPPTEKPPPAPYGVGTPEAPRGEGSRSTIDSDGSNRSDESD
ncbi:MAG: PP2C family serine/threonine-protein phosphatase, partial [Anaerolineae bacterium]